MELCCSQKAMSFSRDTSLLVLIVRQVHRLLGEYVAGPFIADECPNFLFADPFMNEMSHTKDLYCVATIFYEVMTM
jgi:hypothetical protein